jgi:hypothetical protein
MMVLETRQNTPEIEKQSKAISVKRFSTQRTFRLRLSQLFLSLPPSPVASAAHCHSAPAVRTADFYIQELFRRRRRHGVTLSEARTLRNDRNGFWFDDGPHR